MSADRPSLSRAMALLALGVALWVAPAAAVRASGQARTTGDEPHYLVTAISLGEDRDLDVGDEYRARRFVPFHEVALVPQAALQPDGGRISPHDPLLPALLALPMAVGGWLAAKLALAGIAGLLAASMLWVGVRRFDVPLRFALLVVAAYSAAAPLAVYGTQVYPEIAAALALTLAIGALTGPLRSGGLVVLAGSVVALPWLSVKYAPVAAALACFALVVLARRGERSVAFRLAAVLGAATGIYVVAHLAWYGGLTPYASGLFFRGGEWAVVGREPEYAGRATRLIGLLVDRDFGLAAWQPAYLLVLPAAAALVRRRPPGWAVLAVPLAVGWLNAVFVALTMQGWWFPGRQVVVVLPAAVVAVAWWAGQVRVPRSVLVAAAGVGAVIFAGLVVEGLLGRLDLVVDFGDAALLRPWRLLLPDYRRAEELDWALHALWIVLAALLAGAGWRSTGRPAGSVRPGRLAPAVVR